jgi:hypothetical protein
MNTILHKLRPIGYSAMMLLLMAPLGACGESSAPQAAKSAQPPIQSPGSQATATPINACSIFSVAEVEAATGRKVMPGVEENSAGHMSICSYAEPGSQVVAGNPLSTVLVLTVVSGGDDYFQGPEAQVSAIFDMAERNAGEPEQISGLGERAHWASNVDTLRVLRGAHMVEVQVAERDMAGKLISGEPRKIAEQVAAAALEKIH